MVPAGTLPGSPFSQVMQLPSGIMQEVQLIIPPGHAGLTGFQMSVAGTPIIPYGGNPFIVGDDYQHSWEIGQEIEPSQVLLTGYNRDVFTHTFYVRVLWTDGSTQQPFAGNLAVNESGAAATAAAVSDLGQVAQPASASSTALLGSPGPCFDAAGNPVDCSDPTAAFNPDGTPLALPAPAGPAAAPLPSVAPAPVVSPLAAPPPVPAEQPAIAPAASSPGSGTAGAVPPPPPPPLPPVPPPPT